MSQAYDDLLEEVWELIRLFGYKIQKTSASEWWSLELTMAQLKVLLTLMYEGQTTVGEIAETLGIGAPTASHLVDRLVQAGLAERVERSTDRRYTLVCLTPQGETLVRRLHQGRYEQIHSQLALLDEQDLAALRQGLQAFVRASPSTSSQKGCASAAMDERRKKNKDVHHDI